MGGNAIKNTTRLSKSDFETVQKDVEGFFDSIGLRNAVPPCYFSKVDFGDLDILVENSGQMAETINKINERFGVTESSKNSTVYSFGYNYEGNVFQVDVIFVTLKNFDTSYNYLSYNDLFNLLGRLAHKVGFKLGHEGLLVPVKNGDYTLGDVLVTKQLREIFDIIDVDYYRFLEGFETPNDIFEFVTKSKYFTAKMFQLEELNNINRVRNKKRKIYMQFVEYIKDFELKEVHIDKKQFVINVLEKYPEAKVQVQKLWDKLEFQKRVSAVFNGNIVRDITGLNGIELGNMMKHLKSKYSDEFWLTADVKTIVKENM